MAKARGEPSASNERFRQLPSPKSADLVLDTDQPATSFTQQAVSVELVQARRVLLIGLRALSAQCEALTIIGAQAVFERTRSATEIPFTLTIDADTSLAPALVDVSRDIGLDMVAAGFKQENDRPGIWSYSGCNARDAVGFDILVPSSLAGAGRRGARLPGQDKHAVGKAQGLELTLIDRDKMRIDALDGTGFHLDAYVAGPAAITCAKAYKLADRIYVRDGGGKNRVLPKDASDIWRIMAVSDPQHVRAIYAKAESDAAISAAVKKGREYLTMLFSEYGEGADLAVRDLRAAIPEARIRLVIRDWMSEFCSD